jgi:hypothetical protein
MNHTLPVRFGRWLLFVGPAAGLFVLNLFHPNPHTLGSVYQSVSPVVDWWITLHLLLFVLFTLLAFALFVSLAGEQGAAATTARVALGSFVPVACAFVGTEGVGMGLVIRGAQGLPAAQQAGVEQAVQALWDGPTANVLGILHSLLFALAVGASAVALYPAARRPLPLALLGLALVFAGVVTSSGLSGLQLPPLLWVGVNLALLLAVVTVVGAEDRAAIVPFGLLVLAMVLTQHGNPESVVGVVCLGAFLVWRELSARRSAARAPLLAPPVPAPTH